MSEESLNLNRFLQSKNRKQCFSDLEPRYICKICDDLIVDPVQLSCGCRFCSKCIENYMRSNDTCMQCHEPFSNLELLRDRAFNKEIMELLTNCPNEPCQIKFRLKEFNDHIVNCDYRLVDCLDCHRMVQFISMRKHQSECPLGNESCQFCGAIMKRQELKENHLHKEADISKICDSWIVPCPWNCGTTNEPVNVKKHVSVCPNVSVHCDFNDLGCAFYGSNFKLNDHLHNSLNYHMKLLKEYRKAQSIINLDLKNEMDSLRREVAELKSRKCTADNEVSEEVVTPSESSLNYGRNGLRLQKFEWKIDNFLDHVKKSKNFGIIKPEDIENGCYVIRSQPFFTHKTHGYKMKLKLVFPSNKIYKDSQELFINIYFTIIRGEYDQELDWPFNYISNFEVKSNSSTIPNRIRRLLPSNNFSCFGRPQFQQNNPAGLTKFINIQSEVNKFIQADGSIIINTTWLENTKFQNS